MRRKPSLAVPAVVCLALALVPAVRAQSLVTSSFLEGSMGCEDRAPDIAASPAGSFLLVWERQCGLSPGHLISRFYNAEGRPLGPEVDLGLERSPSLAALPDGGYALASVGSAALPGSELRLARLDGRGRRVGAAEIADPGAPAFSLHETPRLAVDRSGNLALIWKRHQPAVPDTLFLLRRYAADLSPRGEAVAFADRLPLFQTSPDLAFSRDGELLLAWSHRVLDEFPNYTAIFGRRYSADGNSEGSSFRLTVPGPGGEHRQPRLLGAQTFDGWLMTWQIAVFDGTFDSRFAHLDKSTLHLGQAIGAEIARGPLPADLAFGTDTAGNVLVLFEEQSGPLALRLFDPEGSAAGELIEVYPFGVFGLDGPTLARSATGSFQLVYAEAGRLVLDQEFTLPLDWDLEGGIVRRACPVANRAVCLLSDRFGVEVLRPAAGGAMENARPVQLNDRGAVFAFSGRIPEIAVRMNQDGTEAELIYAATTNGAVTIRITDRLTGEVKTTAKPAGRFASGRIEGLDASLHPLAFPTVLAPSAIPAAPPLGLFDHRFKVEVTRPGAGGAQPAKGALFDDRRAAFRFGEDLDLTVALIESRPGNGKFWVYLGDLSDGAYRVKITDSVTGKVKVYTKPAGRLLTRVDRLAF